MNRLKVLRQFQKFNLLPTLRRTCYTFEPEYLQDKSTEVDSYDTLNVQIKSYDFPVLENFQKFVHKTAENMGIEVEDCWATPAQKLLVKKLKQHSPVVDCEYEMTVYERNVQIVDVPSTVGAVFLDILHEALPEGVKVRVHEHQDEHEEIRYVPDLELIQLKTELETLGGPSKKKH
ncbi:large ribosomal subunit protein mL48 [Hetaerina americana]|uniref:large ribosomal subunit protein mL48 n=1 Tax=Hetaerina americana TaxID=62018 RepID=UPI003A7F4BD0